MWVVLSIACDHDVLTPFGESRIVLRWADGMVGVMPVFETEQDALEYADGCADVVEVHEVWGTTQMGS